MSKKYVTFGEIMLRLKSPALERFFQSPSLEATFGGGEANVAVSLANYGMDAAFVTALPNNAIGEACRRDVRSFGVDVSNIKMTDGRMGIYFLETGSNQRPSKVVYDRAESAIAIAPVDLFDWEKIFEGADWFHISGIAPAISASAAELSLAACKAAQKCGVTVSCDLNYRKNLWKYGKSAPEVMCELAKYVDVAIAPMVLSLESVFGAVGGALLLGETKTPWQIIGCAIVFAAVIFVQLPVGRKKKAKEATEKQSL